MPKINVAFVFHRTYHGVIIVEAETGHEAVRQVELMVNSDPDDVLEMANNHSTETRPGTIVALED